MQRAMKSTRGQPRPRSNRGGKRFERSQTGISHPPAIQEYAVRHGTRLRFVTNTTVGQAITYQNLLDTLLMAATTTTGFDMFEAVKVRSVEAWCDQTAGNAATIQVIFDGVSVGSVGDQRMHTDTSMGIQPAHVKCRPSSKSLASLFQLSSNNTAFYIGCPSGTVVDVELTFVQSTTLTAVATQNVLVGAVPGAPYWRGLDGLATATTKFTPVVISTTTV